MALRKPKTSAASNRPIKGQAARFRLLRYFSIAGLAMFLLVALALAYFERDQAAFFSEVQQQQNAFFRQVQQEFATQQDESARRDLLAIHESGNVNLTRLFANALWERDFAPFVAKAQAISVDQCRAIADEIDPKDGKAKAPANKKACFADVGRQIKEFTEFNDLNAKVYDSMKKSTVFKIKVFDLRGVTVYSSEHAQMGEDKSSNAGWKGAALEGKPKSELTFRDKFSAFEGVVEKRDLISSYLPVLEPGTGTIVGVFEVYSDVTPFLDQIKKTSAQIRQAAADNQRKIEEASAANQSAVETSSATTLIIVLGLLVLLFASLFGVVRRADNIMTQQDIDREHTQQQLAQSEKMASLGQMVAGVAHQLNTPLAFSHNNVSMAIEALKRFALPLKVAGTFMAMVKNTDGERVTVNVAKSRPQLDRIDENDLDVATPLEMLGDTIQGIDQMRELVENLRDFTRLDRTKTAQFDLNKGLHNVAYIARSVIPTRVQLVEDFAPLPQIECNASQLNQVFLNLINNAAQAIGGDGTVTVRSAVERGRIRVDVVDTGSGIAPDVLPHIFDNYFTTKPAGEGTGLGLSIARSIVEQHGGEIQVRTEPGKGSIFTVYLPIAASAPREDAAVSDFHITATREA